MISYNINIVNQIVCVHDYKEKIVNQIYGLCDSNQSHIFHLTKLNSIRLNMIYLYLTAHVNPIRVDRDSCGYNSP